LLLNALLTGNLQDLPRAKPLQCAGGHGRHYLNDVLAAQTELFSAQMRWRAAANNVLHADQNRAR
jgi:hypothetical protein